jgi:hypothetical protein
MRPRTRPRVAGRTRAPRAARAPVAARAASPQTRPERVRTRLGVADPGVMEKQPRRHTPQHSCQLPRILKTTDSRETHPGMNHPNETRPGVARLA